MMIIQNLDLEINGVGEVKEFTFIQCEKSDKAYMYSSKYSFEVFKRKNTPICIDFEKRIYSDIEFKEVYPKSRNFGIWAWTFKSKEKALLKFKELSHETSS